MDLLLFQTSRHDPWLVLGSVLLASFASFVTLDLASRVRAASARMARAWWAGGSLAMGTGIWSMHFVGMLGFRLDVPLGYEAWTTFSSWLAALVASGIALAIASRDALPRRMLALGSVSMATAICGMHYLGMAALQLAPGIVWHWPTVALSVLVALLASAAALLIFFRMRLYRGRQRVLMQLAAAIVMGVAIAGMHYTGMAAASFPFGVVCLSADALGGEGLGVLVACAASLMLTSALLTSVLDARMQAREALLSNSLRDANEQLRSANDELQRLAFQDGLTGLPNRMLFADRLEHASRRLGRSRGADARGQTEKLAVLFMDLDGFKPINDLYGHGAGDQVLREVAQRLRFIAREADTLARIGGDEFVLLMEGLSGPGDAVSLAERFIASLKRPIECEGRAVELTCSVGIALFPDHAHADKLLACADAAMYVAKRQGGGGYALYDSSMVNDGGEQVELRQALRHAVDRGELQLHYQPKVEAGSARVHGVEALLRWRHPERGLVSPAQFIPIAERFGLIGSIGKWVIDEACAQLARWRQQGHRFRVAVNLSPYQLRQADLVHHISAALARHDLDPGSLVCEITETVAMEDTAVTFDMLNGLAAIGVEVSIDDFGVGYSSLSYLRRLPARQLKIDRSFVKDVDHSADARAVVEAVVRLAHALGLQVVAEGVETEVQRDILEAMHCNLLQGYYFARPMGPDQLDAWLASHPQAEAEATREEPTLSPV